jgi:hypothetical protein
MERWDLIQRINAGASHKVCAMGDGSYKYDTRPYGTALQQEGYPKIQQWINLQWSNESEIECFKFLRDAISRGSIPMLEVAASALKDSPDQSTRFLRRLAPAEIIKLKRLWSIGVSIDNPVLKSWEIG